MAPAHCRNSGKGRVIHVDCLAKPSPALSTDKLSPFSYELQRTAPDLHNRGDNDLIRPTFSGMSMKIPEEIKQDFSREPLDAKSLLPDPFDQFEAWFSQACAENLPAPNAMSLATASADGSPTVRMVLLKVYDRDGFVFFTNYGSRKARQIAENPRVSLLFPWFSMGRQVTITGIAQRIPTAASLRYFLSRSRGSQLGAWTSDQSSVISSRTVLETTLARMKQKFSTGEIPLPDFWGGFRVTPETIEFWQSQPDRLHDRFVYVLDDANSWSIERLAP